MSRTPEQLFVCANDRKIDEAMIEEFYWSTIKSHPFHVLDQTKPLNIYGEPEEEPFYTTVDPPIPIHIKVDPEEEELARYGYDRTREAILWFSRKILTDRCLVPKVGDRVDFIYTVETGITVAEHLIINEISPMEFRAQTGYPFQISAAANRTHKAKQI